MTKSSTPPRRRPAPAAVSWKFTATAGAANLYCRIVAFETRNRRTMAARAAAAQKAAA